MKTLNKIKSIYMLATIVATAFIFASCSKESNVVSKLYVKNEVKKEFKVYVFYSENVSDKNQFLDYCPYQQTVLLDNYSDANYDRSCERNASRQIYIFNASDSTYYMLKGIDFTEDPAPSYISTSNSAEVDNGTETFTYNFNIVINDELISKMTKDVAVTNKLMAVKLH